MCQTDLHTLYMIIGFIWCCKFEKHVYKRERKRENFLKFFHLDTFTDVVLLVNHLIQELELKIELIPIGEDKGF